MKSKLLLNRLIPELTQCRLHATAEKDSYHKKIKGYCLPVPCCLLEKRKSTWKKILPGNLSRPASIKEQFWSSLTKDKWCEHLDIFSFLKSSESFKWLRCLCLFSKMTRPDTENLFLLPADLPRALWEQKQNNVSSTLQNVTKPSVVLVTCTTSSKCYWWREAAHLIRI